MEFGLKAEAETLLTPELTITVTSASPSFGEPAVVVLVVSGSGPVPTGTVTFSVESAKSYAGMLSKGASSLVLYALPPGTYVVTGTYAGDGNYAASASSATVTFAVVADPPARAPTAMNWVPESSAVPSGVRWPAGILDASSNALGTFGYSLVSNIAGGTFPVVGLPAPMTEPLTVGPIFAAGTPIVSLTPMTNPVFRYEGAVVSPSGTGWPGSLFYGSRSVGCTNSSMPFSVEFITTTSWFELMQSGTGSRVRVWVDGAPASRYDTIPALPSNGWIYLQRFDFGTAATRRIRLQFGGGFWFGGIVTPNGSADLMASDEPTSPPFIVMGDSYTEGAGATGNISYAETVAESLGIHNLYASGCGGTGYVNPYNRVAFGGRLQSDVIDLKPQVVLWAGGINDESSPYADIYNAALTDYQAVAEALPGVQQIVVGPWSRGTPLPPGAQAAHDAIKAAAAAVGVSFVDNIDEAWITGTRGNPASGNAYEYISADGTHPTQAGHDYIGNRLALDLIPILGVQTPAVGSYKMTATFAPSDSSRYSGTSVSVQPFLVQGGSPLLLSATSLDFIGMLVGTQSDAKLVTLTNVSTSEVKLLSIGLMGTQSASFLTSNDCGNHLAMGATCTLSVTFVPKVVGAAAAALTLVDDASGSPQSILLTGTGARKPAAATLAPLNLFFGGGASGTHGIPQSVTLSNPGGVELLISNIAITGVGAGSFFSSNNCGLILTADGSCSIQVNYQPGSSQSPAALLKVTDSADNSPQTIAVMGGGSASLTPDLVVYGATPSGIMAAIEAARHGKQVVLLEPRQHVGGMMSNGLGFTDLYSQKAIGGLAREFFQEVDTLYGGNAASKGGTLFEPHVAEQAFNAMLAQAPRITVLLGASLMSVQRSGTVITGLITSNGVEYQGKQYVDASYAGDLMAAAKVNYTVGRESSAQYNEDKGGVGVPRKFGATPIDPFVVRGDPSSGLIAHVAPNTLGAPGAADNSVMAYNYRLCLSSDPENRIPFAAPANYDPAEFELLGRLAAGANPPMGLWNFAGPYSVLNNKFDLNNNGLISTDEVGESLTYPDATVGVRQQMEAEQKRYMQGLLYFLMTDPRVPNIVRWDMSSYFGLCKDEFSDNGGWPRELYVREARRMLGQYVMTENDLKKKTGTPDSIGMGGYSVDSHTTNVVNINGAVYVEGNTGLQLNPYPISYRILTPQASQVTNLLVSVDVSASHVAYDSLRVEPTYMIMGQAAGAAASLAIDNGITVQSVDYNALSAQLHIDGAVLYLDQPVAATPTFSPVAGTYASTQAVTISDNTAGATLFYTTDGTAPTPSSTRYTDVIIVGSTEVVSAIATAGGYTTSAAATTAYTIARPLPVAATPTFSPLAGSYTSAQTVKISDNTAGASIFYTTDGTAPTPSSTKYAGAITVSGTETISAIATSDGYSSSVAATAAYTVDVTPSDFTIAINPSSLTLAFGQSGTSTVSMSPQNGFAAPVSFSCSGLPNGASCTFQATPMTTTDTTVNTKFTVSTSTRVSAVRHNSQSQIPGAVLAFAVCCLGWRKRRRVQMFVILAIGGLSLSMVNGCGATSPAASTPPPPAPTISMITITATAGVLHHTALLSLTVK